MSLRAFVAIEIPDDIKRLVTEKAAHIKGSCISKVREDNMHISLLFMADVTDIQLKAVEEALNAMSMRSFYVSFGEIEFFQDGSPHLAYISIDEGNQQIKNIAEHLRSALKDAVPMEKREFVPHLTVARIKHNCKDEINALKLIGKIAGRFKCDEIKIIQSLIGNGPPIYEEIFAKKL